MNQPDPKVQLLQEAHKELVEIRGQLYELMSRIRDLELILLKL